MNVHMNKISTFSSFRRIMPSPSLQHHQPIVIITVVLLRKPIVRVELHLSNRMQGFCNIVCQREEKMRSCVVTNPICRMLQTLLSFTDISCLKSQDESPLGLVSSCTNPLHNPVIYLSGPDSPSNLPNIINTPSL